MRKIVLALLAVGGLAMTGTTPALAGGYPFCLRGQPTGGTYDCSFTSYRQCMATASGLYAYCTESPFLARAQAEPYLYAQPSRRRRHQSYY